MQFCAVAIINIYEVVLRLSCNIWLTAGGRPSVAGIVIGVLLAVLAIVVTASVVIGIIIREKFSRKQHKKMTAQTLDESQAPSVVDAPTEIVQPQKQPSGWY